MGYVPLIKTTMSIKGLTSLFLLTNDHPNPSRTHKLTASLPAAVTTLTAGTGNGIGGRMRL